MAILRQKDHRECRVGSLGQAAWVEAKPRKWNKGSRNMCRCTSFLDRLALLTERARLLGDASHPFVSDLNNHSKQTESEGQVEFQIQVQLSL
jgi:hypothetical protein